MNIAFFDFDGTMAKGDSLLAFVAFVRGKKRLYWGLFSRCFILIGYALGIISNTKAKQALMRYFFAGMDYKEFLQECERFCPELESRLKPAALARLQWHKDRGDRVVMVSASFEEYLAPLCARLGMECIGTRLATQLKKVDSRGDSALRDKSGISARALQLHTPSMRPCTRLKNPDLLKKLRLRLVFSSQILESPKSYESPTAKRSFFRKQAKRCKAGARKQVSSVIPRILEVENQAEYKKSTQTLESTFVSGEFATPNCYGEQKAVRIRARYDLSNYAEIYAYGDSKGDRAMLELATHAFYKPF